MPLFNPLGSDPFTGSKTADSILRTTFTGR
jgi:hypothetical protein